MLSVRIMWLNGSSGHDAGDLVSQWGSTITSPLVHTVTSRYPSWYDLICCHYVKLQQAISWPIRPLGLVWSASGRCGGGVERPMCCGNPHSYNHTMYKYTVSHNELNRNMRTLTMSAIHKKERISRLSLWVKQKYEYTHYECHTWGRNCSYD